MLVGGPLAGTLLTPIALALDDELVRVVSESIERTLREDGVVKEGDPLFDIAVACDDGTGAPMSFDDDLIEVAGLSGVESPEPEVVDDENIWCE